MVPAVSLGNRVHPRLPLLEGQAAREVRRYSEYLRRARAAFAATRWMIDAFAVVQAARRRSHMVLRL